MIIALSILLTVCICFIVGLSIYILKNRNNKTNVNDTANKEILDKLEKLSQIDKIADKINEINDNHKAVNDKTVAMNQQINNVFKDTQEFVKIKAVLDNNVEEIKTRLSSIPQIHENITSIAKLYDNSKNRGNIGELHLESMLIDTFGENMIERQAPLNGGIIDYKVNTEKPIYIDSKFNKDN
jgi:DNA recombination protein RmuC